MDADLKYEKFLLEIREDINLLKELVHGTRQSVLSSYEGDYNYLMKKEFENKSLTKMEEILDCSWKKIRDILPGHPKDAASGYDGENSIVAHPFTKNNVVLTVIFGFLNLDSIKNCRLVNKTWKETSQLFFDKKVKLSFTSVKDHDKFFDDFGDNRWDCGHYRFSNMSLSLSEATRIFSQDFSTLTSLTLFDVALENEDDAPISDLSFLLGDKKLKKLVVCNYNTSEKMIALEKLSSVEHLELFRCKIIVNAESSVGTRCCPKYLKLCHVFFLTQAGEISTETHFNDLLDFSKASKIIIRHNSFIPALQLNLESTTQKIDTVDLRGIELVINKRLQIKNLKLDSQSIDLSSLPNSLENLEFNGRLTNVVQTDRSLLLLNLNSLCISALERPIEYLEKFSKCCKLKFLKIEKYVEMGNLDPDNFSVECDLSWLPQSVETLQLKDVFVKPGATFRHLKNLAIRRCYFLPKYYLRRNFLVDNLYISFDDCWTSSMSCSKQSELCREMLQDRAFRKTLIVEGFDWQSKKQFKKDPLSQIVDEKSICYSFEGDRGEAVSFVPSYLNPYDIEQNNRFLENKYFQRYIMDENIK